MEWSKNVDTLTFFLYLELFGALGCWVWAYIFAVQPTKRATKGMVVLCGMAGLCAALAFMDTIQEKYQGRPLLLILCQQWGMTLLFGACSYAVTYCSGRLTYVIGVTLKGAIVIAYEKGISHKSEIKEDAVSLLQGSAPPQAHSWKDKKIP